MCCVCVGGGGGGGGHHAPILTFFPKTGAINSAEKICFEASEKQGHVARKGEKGERVSDRGALH